MTRFEQFIKHRQYLLNVSPNTLRWYRHAFKWLPSESPSQEQLDAVILKMRESGLKPTGCNAAARAINAYLHWSSDPSGKCGGGCHHPRIKPMREPEFVPVVFTDDQVTSLVNWRPRGFRDRRLHLLVLLLLDTGARISEVLSLRVADIDFENFLLTLTGKGRKQRRVPFSLELRRTLFKWVHDGKKPQDFILSNAAGLALERNACLRAVKYLCTRLGFDAPPRTLHAFRHSFSTNFVRRVGSPAKLQRLLGHSSITMAMRYVHLSVDDLREGYDAVSLLNRR